MIAAIDFFTVPTLTVRLLYCFFVIDHGRRRILHFNVTEHPSALWIAQQLREAFPNEGGTAIQSRTAMLVKFSEGVIEAIRTIGMKPIRTAYLSPWQNGVDGEMVASCRRDLLDHVIVLNEAHRRDYLHYCHEDRTHNGLDKETPARRRTEHLLATYKGAVFTWCRKSPRSRRNCDAFRPKIATKTLPSSAPIITVQPTHKPICGSKASSINF